MDSLRSVLSEDVLLAERDAQNYRCDACEAPGVEFFDRNWVCERCAAIKALILRIEYLRPSSLRTNHWEEYEPRNPQ